MEIEVKKYVITLLLWHIHPLLDGDHEIGNYNGHL
jgi:hypothetical protein